MTSSMAGCTTLPRKLDVIAWKASETLLEKLSIELSGYQDIGEKNLSDEQRNAQKVTRSKCIELGALRYKLLRTT